MLAPAPALDLVTGQPIVVGASGASRLVRLQAGCTYEARTDAADAVDVYAVTGQVGVPSVQGAPFNRRSPLVFVSTDDVTFAGPAGARVFLRVVVP